MFDIELAKYDGIIYDIAGARLLIWIDLSRNKHKIS